MKRIRRMPVRIRLALISAGLTFAILALFAVVIGVFGARQVRSEFDDELKLYAADYQQQVIEPSLTGPVVIPDALEAPAAGGGAMRVVIPPHVWETRNAPPLGPARSGLRDHGDYRVVARPVKGPSGRTVGYLQFGRPHSGVNHTIARIDLFLAVGVVGGTLLAFLAGLGLARRAMRPIANLTKAARGIAETRDPGVSLPKPEADDEVADLANTLEDMLGALDSARAETEDALARQREFVADASHELRTPLTSILANLELLEAELDGEGREMAGSALRSSRRMRRLVADLLLLARADAGRESLREAVDLADVVSEAAAEAAPVAAGHELSVQLPDRGNGGPMVDGVSD
ncbi:MAG: two-component system, OmpR family, sensor kinase, partial [Thermoleophilaceae bacterium]|nr:two-component system, OmpR family, sensor kinase [Thermoleophilaceae bacterium]